MMPGTACEAAFLWPHSKLVRSGGLAFPSTSNVVQFTTSNYFPPPHSNYHALMLPRAQVHARVLAAKRVHLFQALSDARNTATTAASPVMKLPPARLLRPGGHPRAWPTSMQVSLGDLAYTSCPSEKARVCCSRVPAPRSGRWQVSGHLQCKPVFRTPSTTKVTGQHRRRHASIRSAQLRCEFGWTERESQSAIRPGTTSDTSIRGFRAAYRFVRDVGRNTMVGAHGESRVTLARNLPWPTP